MDKNIVELKEKLEILISDKQLRIQFGKNARDLIVKQFSVNSMVEQTENLYESLVQ